MLCPVLGQADGEGEGELALLKISYDNNFGRKERVTSAMD
jgi:hypothetical protein